jgi:hypothetical protein
MKVFQTKKTAIHSLFSRNVLQKFFLSAFALAVLPAGLFLAPADAQACTNVCPSGDGWEKIEGLSGYEYTYTAPEGKVITDTCYKHASYDPHYEEINPPSSEVTVTADWHGDKHPELSHASFKLEDYSEPKPITVVATKVTCENEEDLPNWGLGGPDITSDTATGWVSGNQTCSLTPEWGFQWAPGNVSNPGDHTSEASGSWTTFGPTDGNGVATVEISEDNLAGTSKIWVREVFQDGFLGFTHSTDKSDVSAEMYCYNDVLNYDNYDYINNPEAGETYYCVAFNVLEEEPPVEGCTDSEAENFNPDAEVDDGSCTYPPVPGCTDPDAMNYDPDATVDDGSCDYPPIEGCTDPDAENFDPDAEIDDGSCVYTPIYGCTDIDAINYDSGATEDDGSCEYYQCSDGLDNDGDGDIDYPDDSGCDDPTDDDENTPPVITLIGDNPLLLLVGDTYTDPGATADDVEDGDITNDIVVGGDTVDTSTTATYTVTYNVTDSDGAAADEVTREVIVSEPVEPIPGCTDPAANNYDPEATENDGSCSYPGPAPYPGCTDPEANNYNPGATWNDGSCSYPGPAPNPGCTDPEATNYNPAATWNDDSCEYPGPAPVYQCSDDIDNDEDGLIDEDDPGCHTDEDADNPDSYVSTDDDETNSEVLPAETCNYLLEYIKFGADNNPVEVLKLQRFLKDYEGFENVPLSGFYDQVSYDAVSKFQMRYFDDVLAPWGHDGPTGYVYITTKKKVNEIYCERPFPLTSGQEDEIEGFKGLLLSLQTQTTSEEIEMETPNTFEEISQSSPVEIEIQGEEATVNFVKENEESVKDKEDTSLVSDVDLADVQLLAEIGEKEDAEKTKESRQETLLAAINFIADNRLMAALIALAVFFFFSIFMIWKKTKPENPTYF